jgi:oxygen-dependent protoporphyrinogen oxidase
MGEQQRLTTVIGAGISGLAAAWELKRRGEDVLVLEASDAVGGCVKTVVHSDCIFECGPTSFPETGHHVFQLAEELGLSAAIQNQEPAASNRLIYVNHRLHRVPASKRQLLRSRLFTPREKFRILMERFVTRGEPNKSESVAEFFHRRFGLAPVLSLVDGFVCGIYAADARRLGMRSAFPVIHGLENKYGSIMKALSVRKRKGKHRLPDLRSFEGGLGRLTQTAADALGPERVKTGVRVASMERMDDGRNACELLPCISRHSFLPAAPLTAWSR